MSTFKVIQILSANTIRVAPGWTVAINGESFEDDKVRISGLKVDPTNAYVQHRLTSFLLQKGVELINATLIPNVDFVGAKISCDVILDGTNITYYFPEFREGLKVTR